MSSVSSVKDRVEGSLPKLKVEIGQPITQWMVFKTATRNISAFEGHIEILKDGIELSNARFGEDLFGTVIPKIFLFWDRIEYIYINSNKK